MSKLFTNRVEYKPFEYPEYYLDGWLPQAQAFWLHTEISMQGDLKDWNENIKPHEKNLVGNKFSNIIKATLIGIPLPLCSCGVIPVATSLYKRGASSASTTSFLISTPQTGIDSIITTYGALVLLQIPNPELWATLRPMAALAAGLLGGVLVKVFNEEDISKEEECSHEKKSFKDC